MVSLTPEAPGFDPRTYLRVLQRRKWIVIVVPILVLGSTLLLTMLQTPLYASQARLVFQQGTLAGGGATATASLDVEVEVLLSEPVRELVKERVGAAAPVTAGPRGGSIIDVRAVSADPEQAAITANAYVDAYLEYRRREALNEVVETTTEIQRQIDDLEGRIDEVQAQIDATKAGERSKLENERAAALAQVSGLRQRKDDLEFQTSINLGIARLVTKASPASEPFRPTPSRNATLAVIVGLIGGAALALLRETLDDSIKSKEALDRALGGHTVLGLIPSVPNWKDRSTPTLVSRDEPGSPTAEAYRSLRTSLQFLSLDRPIRTLQVTSPAAGEGKTTTTANLGFVMAQAGQRVLAVDCDLRRPRLHEFFGVKNALGLTSIMLGEVGSSAATIPVGDPDGVQMTILPSGPVPPNPSELLSSARMGEVLWSLAAEWDVVLLDSPPTLPVTDASVLAGWVDAMLLVVSAGVTSRRHLHRAVEVLDQVKAPLLGAVLNRVDAESSYQYVYGYRYYSRGESDQQGRGDEQRSRVPSVPPGPVPETLASDSPQ